MSTVSCGLSSGARQQKAEATELLQTLHRDIGACVMSGMWLLRFIVNPSHAFTFGLKSLPLARLREFLGVAPFGLTQACPPGKVYLYCGFLVLFALKKAISYGRRKKACLRVFAKRLIGPIPAELILLRGIVEVEEGVALHHVGTISSNTYRKRKTVGTCRSLDLSGLL